MPLRKVAWLCVATVLCAACVPRSVPTASPRPTQGGVEPRTAELVDSTHDLPVTASSSILWFTDLAKDPEVVLELMNVGERTSEHFTLYTEPQFGADRDRIWHVTEDGYLRSMDWDGRPISASPLASASGFQRPTTGPDFVAVTDVPTDAPLMTVELFSSTGTPQCLFTTKRGSVLVRNDEIWLTGSQQRIDPQTCEVVGQLPDWTGATAVFGASGVHVFSYNPLGVTRTDLVTGERTSALVGAMPRQMTLGAESLWVTLDDELVRLSTQSMEVVSRWPIDTSCRGQAVWLFFSEGDVWLVDDCQHQVTRLDVHAGTLAHWPLPTQTQPEQAILSVAKAVDGIWLVEWSGAGPYFFSFERERYERLPEELAQPDRLAYQLAVKPGT